MLKISRLQPIIILVLLFALVVVFSLYVLASAKSYEPRANLTNSDLSNSADQQVYHWTMVTAWPKNLPGLGVSAEKLADYINEASNDRLMVRVHGAGDIVPAMGVFDAVSAGSVQMGHAAAYYWKGKLPAAQFFTAVPFGMNAQEMNGWLFHGGGLALWRELYEPYNVIPFPAGNTGVQMAGWFNKEINSVADLKGLKMRIPGMGGEIFNRAGGTSVTIAGGELYTAMQTGTIDAVEWVGPYNDIPIGLHEVAKYYYYPGWQEPGPTLELIINKQAFASLPKDLQLIVELAARAINQDMLDLYTSSNNTALQQLIANQDIEVRKLPDDVLAALRRAALATYDEIAATDPAFAKVYSAYQAYAEQVEQYHKISEEAYYRLR